MSRYSIILALFFLPFLECSQANQSQDGFWSFQLENDALASNNDRFYTHGAKLSFTSTGPPPDSLNSLADHFPFYKKGEITIHGFAIGQAIFTPDNINEPGLVKHDRPYAGWLFFNTGLGHMYQNRGDRDRHNFLLLTLGLVGPSSLSENTQKAIHEIIDATNPKGWSNQLKDEPGFNIGYLRKARRIYHFDEPRQFELGRHTGIAIGNIYTYVSAGLMARYGTHLKTDIGPPSILPGFSGVPAFNPNRQSHWYLFAGIEARGVARNIFLDGNTFQNSHHVDKKAAVADLQIGAAFHFRDLRVSFVQLFRTKEFEGQSEPTQFGAINFTVYNE